MQFIAAIDQGTTSTRCLIFDHYGQALSSAQKEHRQYYPKAGWVEHDPFEILENSKSVFSDAINKLNISRKDIAALGITNQRETTLLWNRKTGDPFGNAVVWQDTRTDKLCEKYAATGLGKTFIEKTGLPISTYFSGPKIRWLIDNNGDLKKDILDGKVLFGNIDAWLIWNLTGGKRGGIHITDVSNASRTMLMDLITLQWDADLLKIFEIPMEILPDIRSSSDVYGEGVGIMQGIPISGCLGDQQAALFGQVCFHPGDAKNTYGTGCFMLMNTGNQIVKSSHGLLTTVGYKISQQSAVYCLEGSIAVTGALVQWLRDNLGIIRNSSDIEELASSVSDNGGVYFVPAFSGLFAPYWQSDARGLVVGLTGHSNKGHLARAALEATAFQTREILDAMNKDSNIPLKELKVDGGMVINELLMQFQADILNTKVICPKVTETTSLGAAYAAGLAIGYWKNTDGLTANWKVDKMWEPEMGEMHREELYKNWKRAVQRSMNWIA